MATLRIAKKAIYHDSSFDVTDLIEKADSSRLPTMGDRERMKVWWTDKELENCFIKK